MFYDDTIAAISTPPGEGGIGIIRLSGPSSIELVDKIFVPKRKMALSSQKSHFLTYGYILDPSTGSFLDEVLVSIMRKPGSYTREDMVEINSHGGPVVVKDILYILLKMGARLAGAGEFTKRAFLNGRIDLAQAEAVMDLIKAKTDASLKLACSQIEGKLSLKIKELYNNLSFILAHIEADIDYPEDDISPVDFSSVKKDINRIISEIDKLLETAEYGKIFREGIKVAIIGRPNVGKSSLLNGLLREKRAIVTDIPGTTRDSIEEYINLGGYPLQIIDTAGVRYTSDPVEKLGVERTYEIISRAELVIYLLDSSVDFCEIDCEIINKISDKKIIILLNKIDLPKKIVLPLNLPHGEKIEVSLLTAEGIKSVEDTILKVITSDRIYPKDGYVVTNMRHKKALIEAKEFLQEFIFAVNNGFSSDIVSIDLKKSLNALGEITGHNVTEDILNRIFENFCVGK